MFFGLCVFFTINIPILTICRVLNLSLMSVRLVSFLNQNRCRCCVGPLRRCSLRFLWGQVNLVKLVKSVHLVKLVKSVHFGEVGEVGAVGEVCVVCVAHEACVASEADDAMVSCVVSNEQMKKFLLLK